MRLLRPSSKADWSLQDEWSLLQVTIIINIIITILTTCHIIPHLQPTQHWQSRHPAKKPLQVGTLAAHTKGIPLQYYFHPIGFLPLGLQSNGIPSIGIPLLWDSFQYDSHPFLLMGFTCDGVPFLSSIETSKWWDSHQLSILIFKQVEFSQDGNTSDGLPLLEMVSPRNVIDSRYHIALQQPHYGT